MTVDAVAEPDQRGVDTVVHQAPRRGDRDERCDEDRVEEDKQRDLSRDMSLGADDRQKMDNLHSLIHNQIGFAVRGGIFGNWKADFG